MGSGELCRLSRSPFLEQRRQGRESSFQIGDELESNHLLLLPDRATDFFFVASGFERIARALEALPNIDVAEGTALEPRGSPPRHYAVRREQGRCFSWRLDHRLEDQRDGLGLVMRGRRGDQANAGKRIGEARAALRREPISTEETLPML